MALALAVGVGLSACNGTIGGHETATGGGTPTVGGGGPTKVDPGSITVPPTPLPQSVAFAAVRKVENLLTGMAPTDDEVALVTQQGAAGLQQLISKWMTTDPYQTMASTKMLGFFRNMFQQTGFTPTEDFKMQLLTNGGFDFGGNTRSLGDDAFARLVQNRQDSFGLTAWQLVKEGHPFTETLTTNKSLTTGPRASTSRSTRRPTPCPEHDGDAGLTIDYSGSPIPIETALTTMTRSDEAPAITTTGPTDQPPRRRDRRDRDLQRHSAVSALAGLHAPVPSTGTQMCRRRPRGRTYDRPQRLAWVTINAKATPSDRTAAIAPTICPTLATRRS